MAKTPPYEQSPATKLVTAGRRAEWTGAAVNPPVWRASTYLYEDSAAQEAGRHVNADGVFHYGARGGPTQWALADALTALEPGSAGTMLYPTGLAAPVMALLSVLKAGDEVLISDNSYDPTRDFALHALRDYGIAARLFDPLDLGGFAAAIGNSTRAVLLESPGSLSMEVCDVPALARLAKARGLAVLLDNTWAGPTGFQAIRHGVDLSILALTKHVGGHSDVMLGSVTATAQYYPRLRKRSLLLGQQASPDDCALALRGLRTMGVRLERSADRGLAGRTSGSGNGAVPDAARRAGARTVAARFHWRLRALHLCSQGQGRRSPRCLGRRAGTVRDRLQLGRVRKPGAGRPSRARPLGDALAPRRSN
jgi:cystathionine beta-lyase